MTILPSTSGLCNVFVASPAFAAFRRDSRARACVSVSENANNSAHRGGMGSVQISLRERLRPVLNRCRVCAMTTNLRGRRVRLITTTDPYTNLRMGDEGTIVLVDDLGTVHVSWDNGSSLGLVPREDHWQLLDK